MTRSSGSSRPSVSSAQYPKGGVHCSPCTALSYPDWKNVRIYCWVDRVFHLPLNTSRDLNLQTFALHQGASLIASCMPQCIVSWIVSKKYLRYRYSKVSTFYLSLSKVLHIILVDLYFCALCLNSQYPKIK